MRNKRIKKYFGEGRNLGKTAPLNGFWILISLSTCITPLDVEPSQFENYLVVQGFITNDFGPHEIRISRVAQFTGVQGEGEIRIEEAEVRIIDDLGESIELERVTMERKFLRAPELPPCFTGINFAEFQTDYLTPETFRAEIGRTYFLEFVTTDGTIYRSTPQTIISTPPIDSLSIEFTELPSLDPLLPGSGIRVFAHWQDPVDEENFYFWRINGTYRIFTRDQEGRCCAFDPRDGLAELCWIVEKNIPGNVFEFSDGMVNGEQVSLPVGLIEDDGFRFNSTQLPADKKYHIEVEQIAILEETFEFNRRIEILRGINGEIFDPPPLSVLNSGNIFNIEDPQEVIIGRFDAFSVQKRGIFVPQTLLEFTQRWPGPCGDCRIRTGAQIATPEPYRN